jgi:hypothetical protein
MKLSEFTRRARASRLERKARHDAAFQRAIRDLDLTTASPVATSPHTPLTYIRSESHRRVLTLFPRN